MNVATAPQLGVRFLAGLAMLAVLPFVLLDTLARAGILDVAADGTTSRERDAAWAGIEAGMLVFTLACACVVAFARWQRPGLSWRPVRSGFVVARYAPFVLLWTAVLLGYLALARGVGFAVPPQPALEYLATRPLDRPGFWVVVAGVTIGAPVAEEIVFRGYLQPALLCMFRPWVAVVLTAAAFGAVHTLPYALPVGLLGAFFGMLAARTGSLGPAIVCHALHNTLTVALTVLWPQSLNLLYPR